MHSQSIVFARNEAISFAKSNSRVHCSAIASFLAMTDFYGYTVKKNLKSKILKLVPNAPKIVVNMYFIKKTRIVYL